MRNWISAGSGPCHPPTHWRGWPTSWWLLRHRTGIVARIDWARFLPLYQMAGKRAFLAELEREVPEAAPAPTAVRDHALVERLTVAPVQQRKQLVVEYLRDAVAEVTRIDAAEIREEAGFFDLGMDSLMAVEMRRRLEQAVGKELPVTLAMDYPRSPTWRTTCSATCSGSARRRPAEPASGS